MPLPSPTLFRPVTQNAFCSASQVPALPVLQPPKHVMLGFKSHWTNGCSRPGSPLRAQSCFQPGTAGFKASLCVLRGILSGWEVSAQIRGPQYWAVCRKHAQARHDGSQEPRPVL